MAEQEPKSRDIKLGRLPADSKVYHQKRAEILQASKKQDVGSLVELATSEGGLLQDDIRKQVWPILQGYNHATHTQELPPLSELPSHGDEDQVRLDVNRSFVYYPNYKTERHLEGKREELLDLIISVLRRNPMLCYFQGYHDIAQVLLLVLDRKHAYHALEHISLFRIRDYMLPSLSPALTHLQLLPAIITSVDQKLGQHLAGIQPFFALAATLTLYAHDIEEYTDIARLYDFILAHEPVVSIYLFATIILSRKDELYDIPTDEPELFHGILSKLPRPLDLEALISRTVQIYHAHPPEKLPHGAWRTIPSCSVLKTLRNPGLHSTPEQARSYFQQQIQGLRREKMRKDAAVLIQKHSRSIQVVGTAVIVGIISYWIMKKDPDMMRYLWRCLGPLRATFRI
ncbi:GTPase-activating protein gyp8 [Microsporum audouinii]